MADPAHTADKDFIEEASRLYADAFQDRVYRQTHRVDGPDEVHLSQIAAQVMAAVRDEQHAKAAGLDLL